MGPRNGVPATRASRGAPRGDDCNCGPRLWPYSLFKQPISFPRRVLPRPGFAILASPTRIEGWAERRETFGCLRGPVGHAITRRTRRLASALRPMTQQTAGGNNLMISRKGVPSVPIVSQRAACPHRCGESCEYWGTPQRLPRIQHYLTGMMIGWPFSAIRKSITRARSAVLGFLMR